MNTINGQISAIKTSGSLSKIEISVAELQFKTIVIDTPESASYLYLKNWVKMLFKETEVAIGTGDLSSISLQNKIVGTVHSVKMGDLQARVVLDTDVGKIKSIITVDAVHQLKLKKGIKATALIKTNEVMLYGI